MKIYLLLPLLALGSLSSCTKKAASSSSSHALKIADFPTFIANRGTLNIVNFSATWCPVCQQLNPTLSSISDKYSDTVRLGVVDIDTENSLATQQGVRGIPDVRFYIDGKLVDKFSVAASKEHIEQIIAKHSKNLTPVDAEKITPPSLPADSTAPARSVAPAKLSSPATPTPTIQTSKENPLPPGISKQ